MRWAVVLCIALLSGCINDFEDDSLVENYLNIRSIDVSAPEVRSGSLDLSVFTTLDNEMGRSGEVVVQVKAFDTSTGLLVETGTTPMGRIDADKTVVATTAFELPRATGYRLEVTTFEDEQVRQVRSATMNNLDALPPNLHETGISISSMDFFVENATGKRALITASLYVTNEGSDASRPLRVQVKAREVSTALIADEAWLDLTSIPPEETHPQETLLDVPQGYNYEVEAVIWDGNFIVGRDSGNVQLLPTFVVPKDSEVEVITPDLGDFSRGDGGSADGGYGDGDASSPGPAFWAIMVIIGGIAWMKRRK